MGRTVSSLRSKRFQTKKRKTLVYKYVGIAAFVALLVGGLAYMTHVDAVQITKIHVEGNKIVSRSDLESIVTEAQNARVLGIFSRNNVALFPRSDTRDQVTSRFKAIASATAAFDGLHTLTLSVQELEPAYLWCDSELREHCYFMDSHGYIFSESADFSQNILFTFYGLIDPAKPIGATYMDSQQFAEIIKFVASTKQLDLDPIGLVVSDQGLGDFTLLLAGGGKVLFSDREPYLTVYENLEAVVHEQKKTQPDFVTRLDYIDVRFANKAFIKLK